MQWPFFWHQKVYRSLSEGKFAQMRCGTGCQVFLWPHKAIAVGNTSATTDCAQVHQSDQLRYPPKLTSSVVGSRLMSGLLHLRYKIP